MTDENTNELESYGVWVKNNSSTPSQEEAKQETDISSEDTLDLPDFDNTDFSDMFKDDAQFTSDQSAEESFSDDLDSTLSTDELANITDFADVSIEEVDAPETSDASLEIDDNFMQEEVSLDTTEETDVTSSFEDVSFEDEEISLDDFMTEGFSDESVAAGNNGYEPGAEPKADSSSSGTEELSLDDFLDGDSFDMAPPEVKQQQEDVIEDEPPLEMEINFDDSADSVQTEENIEVDTTIDDDTVETDSFDSDQTEEVSLDDFSTSFDTTVSETPVTSSSSSDFSTEEVDLSDFGIDADAEETPIQQNVEEAKNKEVVVDYDLNVGDENTSAGPVVNEIKSETPKAEESVTEDQAPAVPENSTVVENSLLQQIVADLSGLKDEINRLKQNLADMKNNDAQTTSPAASEEAVESEIIFEDTKEDAGFFGADDGDETIALSCDELSNIMNTAEFNDTIETQVNTDELDSFNIGESNTDISEENSVDFSENETVAEENVKTEITEDETPAFEVAEEPAETEITEDETPAFDISEEPAETEITEDETLAFDITEEPAETEITEDETPAFDISEESSADVFAEESVPDSIIVDESDGISEEILFEDESTVETAEETEISFEEEVTEEPVFDSNEEISATDDISVVEEEISFDDVPAETSVTLEETPVEEEISFENTEDSEIIESDETVSFEDTVEDNINISTEESNTPEESIFDEPDDIIQDETEVAFDFTDENLEEPNIDEIVTESDDEPEEDDDLPAEISIPKDDEMFVESTSSDFMDSVKDTTDETVEEAPADINDDIPLELPEEEIIAPEDDDIPTVDKLLGEEITETPVEETAVTFEEPEEDNFAEVDNLDNNLTESNMNYLTENSNSSSEETSGINSDLKQEIKSVLLYMDQLLENLPEEKIVEFAKSDEFTTYKKLFTELGLS